MATELYFKICIYIFFSVALFAGSGLSQIDPPTEPPPGLKPVISNGIVYNLWHIPVECQKPEVFDQTEFRYGAVIATRKKKAIMKDGSPYRIHGNLALSPLSCLYIEPGTVLYFGPGYGMIINGTLIGRGSELDGQRIVMTKDPDNLSLVGPSNPFPQDARLVDGNTTRDGRLELYYMGKWRGVCTNYNNYTKIDANVTCRHLGFVWGNFTYNSFSRNKTEYMLFEKPQCKGTENTLFDCPGRFSILVGSHICDGQQVIGFECAGLRSDLAKDYWRGLEFYNATIKTVNNVNMKTKETLSFLEYLDISYAGKDVYRGDGMIHGRASISASPYVPLMNNVTVTNGAYDGLNFTEIRGRIHIANSTISGHRGYGVFIETAVGRVLINKTNVDNNWGDGVKTYMKNFTIHDFERDFPSRLSYCRTGSLAYPSYPMLVHENIIDENGNRPVAGYTCDKVYPTLPGMRITLHFLLMERDPAAKGTMTVYDQGETGTKLAEFPVSNGTFPQSITSITNKLYVKFQYQLPPEPPFGSKEQRCKIFRPCFRMLMELWSGPGLDEDLRFFNSSASNNNGYGVNVHDMRSKVFVNSSVISDNKYGGGLRIYQGAGEVAVNNSVFERNVHCGINITYAGGYTLINRSRIIDNKGYGVITEYERLNRSRIERGLKMEIVKSVFSLNKWIALRIGNYCKGGQILVNESNFNMNYDEAIEYLSCNVSIGSMPKTNFSLAYNVFDRNSRHGVLMSPFVNSVGRMTNNTFKRHVLGAVRIDNGYDLLVSRWYAQFGVSYEIFANKFIENHGRYCASLRLTQDAPNQKLDFKFNIVHGNFIYDSSVYLNPRNRANAPIVVSSSNIRVQRNSINNPQSVRDVATHLIDPSVTIDGSLNWWGTIEHKFIYGRYFDNDDRYNLAVVNYYPVLKNDWLYGDKNTNENPAYRWVFASENHIIGGVLDVPGFTTDPNVKTYHVNKDIFILPGATLTINPGTALEFENSIGMVVHGRLRADGHTSNSPVLFRLKKDLNETAIVNRTATVKLLDGFDEFEGRVEVEINGEWGTVCREEWIEQNSAVVCQQLGLTFNPQYGNVRQRTAPDANKKMLLNRVQCDILDIDITKCRAEVVGEFSCNSDMAVYVRCQPPTWSGVTIPGIPTGGQLQPTQIRYLTIENAGLLDYEEMMYTAALRIDYNFYKITGLIIRGSVSDGVNIKYSNPHTENLFEYCKFDNNQGNGFVTKSPNLKIHFATMNNNVNGGFVYDPFFTEYEALSVRNFIHRNWIVLLTTRTLKLGDNSMIFITTQAGHVRHNATYRMQLYTSPMYRVTLQILDYNPLTNIEKVIIRDGRPGTTKVWEIERDLVEFPVISTTNYITIELKVSGIISGRLTFAAHAREFSATPLQSRIFLHNCTMQHNYHGIITRHYNNPSNEKLEIFHRIKAEEIKFQLVNVFNNVIAMYIPSLTKYTENLIPSYEEMTSPELVGEITYVMDQCRFIDNEKGIVADHNHVDFANNVWHWFFTGSHIRGCKSGGLEIDLPRVNDIQERKFHSVYVNESFFIGNRDFALTVAGYYANVTIMRSDFKNNLCKNGLLSLSGMEKDLSIFSNDFSGNTGKYAIELDLMSHSEYSKTVGGLIKFNKIMDNRPVSNYMDNSWNYPFTYAVALKGVQNIVVNRNLIDNKQMQYELVAGVNSLSLDSVVNVKENWWGTPIQTEIRRRIFDFDDWNNYAIADYFPQLTSIDVNGRPATGSQIDSELDLGHVGGRIYGEKTLPAKAEPYVVVSDLTIMPNAKLIIQPGTELQFYPNVGILVLGQLRAKGLPLARIKFKPIKVQNRVRRAGNIVSKIQNSALPIRLRRKDGAMLENEGFLELYNTSTKTWNIMCDSQLNEKTAEVVCREMGLETVNVDVRFTHLYDFYIHGKPMYFLKEFWTYSYYCRGDEQSLDFCMKRINYDIQKCIQAANYTFIRCGERNLPKDYNYWGNIRIAPPTYEQEISSSIHMEEKTILQYADVEGAGILHGEKVGAIQSSYKTPILKNINITKSLSNGIDIIAPGHGLALQDLNITNNLGYGINVLVLNGESKEVEKSSFVPLSINTVPYHLYGLVDICKMEKEIIVKHRLIVFFKYSQRSFDCVKVVKSDNQFQKVVLRFLQFNLYDDAFYRNVIEIFDDEVVTSSTLIGELLANSSESEIRQRYMSRGRSLSIHIHASTAFSDYGFIAEVVTYPLSGLTYPGRSVEHSVQHVVIKDNQDGAIMYKNVGEVNPSVLIDMCLIENNGIAILNLTSKPVIDLRITDTVKFNFEHNFVNKNKGGMQIIALAQSQSTSIRANITNNVFSSGTNGETLNISGHHYNRFYFYENYIHNNLAGDFRDTIHFKQVVVNFTFNTVINNTGHHILRTFNAEDTGATQRFIANAFIENNTTAKYRSVIKVGSGKPIINSNFLLNEDCEFELQTADRKVSVNGIEIMESPIDAKENWWGSERRGYINGKIWDYQDNSSLVSVQFDPFKVTNLSLVDGKCAPGWHLYADMCFRYMGAALPYHQAVTFCEENQGFLAEIKDREKYLRYLLRTSENAYRKDMRVWVYSDVSPGFCSTFQDTYVVAEPECYRKLQPFICQKEPYLSAPGFDILNVVIGICAGVFGTALIVIIILVILWKLKSRRRKAERFERRSSIRSSARSRSNLTMLSDAPSKRRIHDFDKYSVSAVSSRSRSRYDSDEKSMFASEASESGMHLDERNFDSGKRRQEMNGRAGSQDRLNERNGHIANRARFGSREGLDDSDRKRFTKDRLYDSNRKLGSRDNLNSPGRQYGSRDRLNDPDRKFGSQDKLDNSGRLGSQDRLNDSGRFGSREGLNDSNRRLGTRDGVNSSNRRLGDRTRTREPDRNLGSRDGLNENDKKMGSRDRLNETSKSGRLGSQDKLNDSGRRLGSQDKLNDSGRRLGSQDKLNDSGLRRGSRDKLNDSGRQFGSRDRLLPEAQVMLPRKEEQKVAPTAMRFKPRNYVANESPGSTLERKLVKHAPPSVTKDELEMYTTDDTYDGYSTNEFDDTTSVEDENEKKAFDTDNDDTNTVVSFHPSGPPRVENQIDSLRMVSSIPDALYDNRGYQTSPSIEYNDRSKSLSSFSQPNSPISPTTPNHSLPNYLENYREPSPELRPPTPPPPLHVDSIPNPMRQFRNSPTPVSYRGSPVTSQSSENPVPVPRSRPIPPPRPNSFKGSKDSVKHINTQPVHDSRESLDFLDNRSNLQDQQICDISKSEDSLHDQPYRNPGGDNLAYLHGSREHLANQYNPNAGYTNGIRQDIPHEMSNMDYMSGDGSHVGYGHEVEPAFQGSRSREDIRNEPYNVNYMGGSSNSLNYISRSRENLGDIHNDGTLVIGGRQVSRNPHAVETDV